MFKYLKSFFVSGPKLEPVPDQPDYFQDKRLANAACGTYIVSTKTFYILNISKYNEQIFTPLKHTILEQSIYCDTNLANNLNSDALIVVKPYNLYVKENDIYVPYNKKIKIFTNL